MNDIREALIYVLRADSPLAYAGSAAIGNDHATDVRADGRLRVRGFPSPIASGGTRRRVRRRLTGSAAWAFPSAPPGVGEGVGHKGWRRARPGNVPNAFFLQHLKQAAAAFRFEKKVAEVENSVDGAAIQLIPFANCKRHFRDTARSHSFAATCLAAAAPHTPPGRVAPAAPAAATKALSHRRDRPVHRRLPPDHPQLHHHGPDH